MSDTAKVPRSKVVVPQVPDSQLKMRALADHPGGRQPLGVELTVSPKDNISASAD